jgi:hypothetical protein
VLTLTPPGRPLDRRALTTPGAFCWWYGDVVDGDGNGVVVIGAFGLPFLERRDALTVPQARPSLNVAVYERGVCTFYALLELPDSASHANRNANDAVQEVCAWHDADPVTGAGERWRFGRSTLGFDVGADGTGRFFAALDVVLPVGTVQGQIEIEGPLRSSEGHGFHTLGTPPAVVGITDGIGTVIAHDWSPQLGPSRGEARLVIDGHARVITGSGYHDRNGALCPLQAQGIGWWLWGRADVDVDDGGRESRVIYALWPRDGQPVAAVGVVTGGDGRSRVVDLVMDVERRRTWLGIDEVRRFAARERSSGASFLVGEVASRVDDGPFYLRHTLRAGVAAVSTEVRGFLEVVDVAQIDRPWQRPFVRMRVTPAESSSSSLWHPLFAGARDGRVRRQLRWLMGDRS